MKYTFDIPESVDLQALIMDLKQSTDIKPVSLTTARGWMDIESVGDGTWKETTYEPPKNSHRLEVEIEDKQVAMMFKLKYGLVNAPKDWLYK